MAMSVRSCGAVLVLISLLLVSMMIGITSEGAAEDDMNGISFDAASPSLRSEVQVGDGPYDLTVAWSYLNEGGDGNLSCRHAKAELVSEDYFGMKVLAGAVTDAEGLVVFKGLSTGLYAVVIYAEDRSTVKVISDSIEGHDTYSWSTETYVISGSRNLTQVIGGTERGAWNAYDVIRTAASWLDAQVGWTRDKVSVVWPTEAWPHSHGDSIHIPAAASEQDFIWDDYTLMHEYGHSVHFAVRGGSFPEIEGPDPHYLDSESSGPSALVEGWAIFFACAVEGDANKTSRLSLESTVFADSPLFNGDYGDWDGNEVEGAVANVLWDIYDGISADDHPPWDRSGHGDGIDNEFSTFWKIFIEDRPESMDDVWAAWENKNASLAYVFRHARFDKQATLPTNPTDFVSNIEVGVTSNETSMIVSWSGATGSGSAIAGYSILWDHSPDGEPDQYIDVYGPSIQTSNMDAGTWYLHIRAVDQNGNAAIGSFDVGPFIIGSKASDAVGGSDLINTLGEIAIVAMLAVALLLLIWLVTRVVRKPTKEDVEPYIPPWQMHNPYYAPPYAPYYGGMAPLPPVMPNAPYPPPMPPTYPIQQPQGPVIRYCQGCGRPDAGGQFCPYCGTKVR